MKVVAITVEEIARGLWITFITEEKTSWAYELMNH